MNTRNQISGDYAKEEDVLHNLVFTKYTVTYNPEGILSPGRNFYVDLHRRFGQALVRCDGLRGWKKGTCYHLFHPEIGEDHPLKSLFREGIPKPYVFSIHNDGHRKDNGRNAFRLDLTLIGSISENKGLLADVLEQLGKIGLGDPSVPCEMTGLEVGYSYPDHPSREKISCEGDIMVMLDTPLDFNQKTDLGHQLPFITFYHRLFTRLYHLTFFHCGMDEVKDTRTYYNVQSRIETVENQLQPTRFRYSSKGKAGKKLGYTGYIRYRGNFTPYMDLLNLGQHIHTGNSTAFGCGKYRLMYVQPVV